MVDGKPLTGTVSMLASKFTRLGSPKNKETDPGLTQAIETLMEETKRYNSPHLIDLVYKYMSFVKMGAYYLVGTIT